MSPLRTKFALKSLVGGALLAFMLACGGGGSPPAPPPPPAPFQPQVVVVDLGANGGKTTVISTQAGGWTRNGEPFTSGSEVTGENGSTYSLTLANGRWTAEFVASEPVTVAIGNSGESASIEQQEDGSYLLGGEPLANGDIRAAGNGNQYRFSRAADGTWSVSYVPPEPTVVPLGQSSTTATLVRQEDGTYALGGSTLASGEVWEAPNGNSYRFTFENEIWTAEFVAGQATAVALGNSGATAELVLQEDGRYALDGEPIFSGQVRTAANGNQYRFVQRSLGVWVAEFVPAAPVAVPLGNSGQTASLQRLENGTYTLDGMTVYSGNVLTVGSGSNYRFILQGDGTWRAEFVSAQPVTVALGNSGNTVSLTVLENRNVVLDGELVINDQVRTINGVRYRFSLGLDGLWRATYVSEMVTVVLGTAGGSIVLTRLENGSFTRDGLPVVDGDEVTGNGQRYRLTFGNGQWVAEHISESVSVSIPNSDVVITLQLREDGLYVYEGGIVRSGDQVTVGDSTYELNLSNGRWSAEFVAGRVTVQVGSRGAFLTLIRLADGTYEHDGRRVRHGSVVRHPESGVRYTLSLRDGVWSARVYFPPIEGGGGGGTSPGGTPAEVQDLTDALPIDFLRDSGNLNDQADLLKANQQDAEDVDGNEVDYSEYEGSGATEAGTYVEAARNVLQRIIDDVKPLVEGDDSQQFVARVVINAQWQAARDALSTIFDEVNGMSAGEALLRNLPSNSDDIDQEDRLEDLEELVEALESLSEFRSELGTFGEFGAFNRAQENAEEIYNARRRSLAVGATENTRFGVIAEPSGGDSTTAEDVAAGTQDLVARAFAFSPLDQALTSTLPSRGTARYTGTTFAIDPEDGDLFSGTINLLASFGIERITAEITGLDDTENGDTWEYDGRAVEKIELPVIEEGELGANGSFDNTSGSANLELEGTQFDQEPDAEFKGIFVGDEGEEVFGTWAILGSGNARLLDGSFGAEYRSTTRVTLPDSDNDGRTLTFEDANSGTTLDADDDTLIVAGSVLAATTRTFGLNNLYRRSSDTNREDVNGVDHTLIIRFRHTSYTRFGAWAHTTADSVVDTGFFGYSPLAETTFDATNFPRNVQAEYVGRTVAVTSEGALYDGDYSLVVDWSDSGGELESVIRNLRAVSGGARFEIQGIDVELIAFQDTISAGGQLNFESPTNALVEFVTDTQTTLSNTTHLGHFLGNPSGVDGPYAVIGSWSVTQGGAQISGEFGADLDPSP